MTAERLPREDRAALMRDQRRVKIMRAAVAQAELRGYRTMTRVGIAAAAGVSVGSINHEFGTMDALRDAVMRDAVSAWRPGIIAQGLADGHAVAQDAPVELKEAAVRALA